MPMTIAQRKEIIQFLDANNIRYEITSPRTYTSSVDQENALVINVKDKNQLPELVKKINEINLRNGDEQVNASVIGGGRGGNNNSYSIGKLWNDVDVFIQLGWDPEPEFTVLTTPPLIKKHKHKKTEKPELKPTEALCRISPNMMLSELNRRLYKEGYHCPTLCGSLPFMSFAGGLSTGSHTSYGYLSDIVQGVLLLLPNGKEKYFKKGDKEFDLIVDKASLGLLGTIIAVDIKVNKGRKNLKRVVEFSTYGEFMGEIHDQVAEGVSLESRSVIFSGVDLNSESRVKLTRWEWVPEDAFEGVPGPQVADDSFVARKIGPMIAKQFPEMFSSVFQSVTLSPDLAGTVIAEPEAVMAPESKLAGQLTELGIFFDYGGENTDKALRRLSEILQAKRDQGEFPINTAIFMRFPKKPNSDQHLVAIDFASLSLDLKDTKAFVNEVIAYLESEGIKVNLHYGKSSGVSVNQALSERTEGWEKTKERFSKFYKHHHLDQSLLKKKLIALEQADTQSVELQKDNVEEVYQRYLAGCDDEQKHLEKEMDKLLKKYPDFEYHSAVNADNRYDLLVKMRHDSFPEHKDIEKDVAKIKQDKALAKVVHKYEIVSSLKTKLTSDPTKEKGIAAFEQLIDQKRIELKAQRDTEVYKWLGVFAAGLCGLLGVGIGAYFAGKAAHARLFKTKTEKILIAGVDKIRQDKHFPARKKTG